LNRELKEVKEFGLQKPRGGVFKAEGRGNVKALEQKYMGCTEAKKDDQYGRYRKSL
jgi:hypothetical protein